MSDGKARAFICPGTGILCKYTGCRRAFCRLEAANPNLKNVREAEDALKTYLAEIQQPKVKL
jgi:hypothetical protein